VCVAAIYGYDVQSGEYSLKEFGTALIMVAPLNLVGVYAPLKVLLQESTIDRKVKKLDRYHPRAGIFSVHMVEAVIMTVLSLVLQLPASSMWREQQGVHAVHGPGMFCVAQSTSAAAPLCISWEFGATWWLLWGLSMFHLFFRIQHDWPRQFDSEEAWHSELIQDLSAAKRESQRELIVMIIDGIDDTATPGNSSQVHPEGPAEGGEGQVHPAETEDRTSDTSRHSPNPNPNPNLTSTLTLY